MKKIKVMKPFVSMFIFFCFNASLAAPPPAGDCFIDVHNIILGNFTGEEITVQTDFVVRCTGNVTYDSVCVGLTDGEFSSNNQRRVYNANKCMIYYNVFRDNSYAANKVWRNFSNTLKCVYNTNCSPSNPCIFTAYAFIPSLPSSKLCPPETYIDHLQAILYLNSTHNPVVGSETDFYVQTYIQDGCNISSDTFNLGTYLSGDSVTACIPGTNLIHVNCSLGKSYDVHLDYGFFGNSPRRMYKVDEPNTYYLSYNLYNDANCLNITSPTSPLVIGGIGSGDIQNYTVYGRIDPAQSAPAGLYYDRVMVTVTY